MSLGRIPVDLACRWIDHGRTLARREHRMFPAGIELRNMPSGAYLYTSQLAHSFCRIHKPGAYFGKVQRKATHAKILNRTTVY